MKKNILFCLLSFYIIYLGIAINSMNNKYEQLNSELVNSINYSASLQGNYKDLPIVEQFKLAGQVYDTDYRMIYAIACHETGNFTSNLFLNKNNPGGIKGGDGWMSFPSRLEGIMEMTRMIKRNYINRGYDTLEKMEPIYCPDGSNWAEKVNSYMTSLN